MRIWVTSDGERRCSFPTLAGILFLMVASSATAQIQFGFELSYSNPGARNLGFGGAFVALADDATAAFANPAGLTQLVVPEVSVEGRSWSYSTPFLASGRVSGQPTGIGIDTEAGTRRPRSEVDLSGLSFLSFVYPGKKWSLALYRHQLADFEFFNETQGIFAEGSAGPARVPDQRGSTDIEIVAHGFAAGLEVRENLRLGLGLVLYDGNQTVRSEAFLWDEDPLAGFFAGTSFLPERQFFDASVLVDDQAWGITAGLLWNFAERWNLGAVFRQGPEFDGKFVFVPGPSLMSLGTAPITGPMRFSYPDLYGLGLVFRSRDGRSTVSCELDRVGYSSLSDSIREIEKRDDRFRLPFEMNDGTELHFGAEHAFLAVTPLLAVRLGVWLDPDHLVHVSSDSGLPAMLAPGGDDEIHYAVGLGVAFETFQIDLAADFSDLRDTVSLSAIYGF